MLPGSWRASPTVFCWVPIRSSISSDAAWKVSTRANMDLLSVDAEVVAEVQRARDRGEDDRSDRARGVELRAVVVRHRRDRAHGDADELKEVDVDAGRCKRC